jgi:hypothetical protein
LLTGYEYSITKRLAADQNIHYPIRVSFTSRDNTSIRPFVFHWYAEIRSRKTTTDFLARHDISDLSRLGLRDSTSRNSDTDPSKPLFAADRIKTDTLLLLYQLVDVSAGFKKKHSIRASQVEFLEMSTTLELAKIGYLVKALGLGYEQHLKLQPERMPDYSIRERVCVFEDKVLRHGPDFAWAVIAGTAKARTWAREVMDEGLKDMEDFEKGHREAYAGLQSVVWKFFCSQARCDMANSWDKMREMIERETDAATDANADSISDTA